VKVKIPRKRVSQLWMIMSVHFAASVLFAAPEPSAHLVHGLWVWKSPDVLKAQRGAEKLRDFCTSQGINEIYVSYSAASRQAEEAGFIHLIDLMHRSQVHVEALLSSTDADQAGKHRDKLLDHVREVIAFNRAHVGKQFDGIHLDIEPQQRPENKGPGNLRFLPGLVDAFRDVRNLAEPAGLTVNADIQNKLLKGDLTQRAMLLSSVSRLTLMMYELSSPNDGQTPAQKADRAVKESEKYLAMAYDGLSDHQVARIAIALRTLDYGELLPQMLKTLDKADSTNPHYMGSARHSYNDVLLEQ
jgi:hypothetical protein